MCGPMELAAATAAVGVTEDVLGFVGQRQAFSANKQAANQNYFDRVSALDAQRSELDAADAQRVIDEEIARVQEGGRIAVIGGEFLGAASQARLRNAAANTSERDEAVGDLNSQNQRRQIGRETRGAGIERDAQIAKVAKPSVASLVVKTAGRGLQAATDYMKMK